MITYRPPASRAGGSGPAYDDTAIRERLDTLEANRSASPAFRPELRSRAGGLTLDSDTDALVAAGGILTFRIRTPSGSEIRADSFSGPIRRFVSDIGVSDPEGFVEAFIEGGHLVIRPADPTAPLHVTTAMPDTVVATFAAIDDTWFGQDVYPRPVGTYDTTSGAVRLTGPEGAYAPGSGLSVSTALEALKRLHHSRDLLVEDRDLLVVPDGLDPFTVTLRQIGAELGQTAALAQLTLDDSEVSGGSISVTDLDETVTAFIGRIPGIGGAFAETDGPGRPTIAFYMLDDAWHLPSQVRDTFGSVAIDSAAFPDRPRIRRILTRLHSDDVFVNSAFATTHSGSHSYGFASGQLSTVLGTMLGEIRSLRARVADLEARP